MFQNSSADMWSVRAVSEARVSSLTAATRAGLARSMGGATLATVWPQWLQNTAADFQNLYVDK